MRKAFSLYIALTVSFFAFAQSDGNAYVFHPQKNFISLDFKKIDNFHKRLYLLYSLTVDNRFLVTNSDDDCVFFITCDDENLSGSLFEDTFINFMEEKTEEFGSFDKKAVAMSEASWKNSIPDSFMLSMMMDYITAGSPRADNDSCYKAEPFCTDYGLYTFSAMTGDGHFAESGPSYPCLDQQPCPSWYYMKISTPGAFTIHIEGYDGDTSRDVDFCCWGPFDDPKSPCPNGLTEDKVTDCSYSGTHTEDCHIPGTAQGGEYYIMVITNYSKTTCIITFEKSEGSGPGTTDCSIMPPAIEYHNPCYGGTLQLSAHEVNNATYSWTGPNGFTSDIREPVIENVTFDNIGNYECYVTVPGQGSSDPMSIYVEILPELHADFSPNSTCSGGEVQFTGMETTTPAGHNDAITSRTWDFGDGSPIVSGENPVHTFPGLGSYEVTYTIVAEAADESGETCENTVTKTFTVSETDIVGISDTTCAGQNYHEYGFDIENPEAGITFDTLFLSSTAGCDSIVYLELLVGDVYEVRFTDTTCVNEGYHEHGFALDSLPVGWHFDTINPGTVLGCDSLVYLELYVTPVFDTTFVDTICFGNGYHEHGFDLDSLDIEIGMNYDTLFLQTILGCDSIVYLELLVGDVFEVSFTDTTCVNEGYHQHGFEIDSLGLGWLYDTLFLSSAVGCDSTVMLELFVAPVFDTTFFDTICYGYNYFEHGFTIENPDAGWNFDTLDLSTVLGCDSTIYLELYVAPAYDIKLFDTICLGESYHLYGFDFENPEVGTHSETHEFETVLGCDSIMTMNLFVGDVYDILLRDTICLGEDYDNYNFHFANPPVGDNDWTQSLTSMYGCDSTVSLSLHVAPIYDFIVYDSICEGDDYTSYGLHIEQPLPGTHSHTSVLKTELGCDSVFNVTFKVIYTYQTPDTLYGLNSVFVSTDLLPGKYKYSIDTITGCNKYHWELDNDDWIMQPDRNECTVIVTTPVVTTLTVRAGNSCDEVSKSIEIHAGYFGVDENGAVDVNVYPNPCNDLVNIECDNIERINVYDTSGATVMSEIFDKENKVVLNIESLRASLYLIEIITTERKLSKKIAVGIR